MNIKAYYEIKTINIYQLLKFSVLEIIQTYEKINNIKVNYKITERREGDVAIVSACPDKIFKELGWKAKKNLEDMCRDSYNFIKNNKNGIN